MENPASPHDRYFRSAMANPDVAKDFFQHYLPKKIQEKIDWNSLKMCKESFISPQFKLRMADVLFAVNIQQQPGYIYLLVEHQSTADRLMPFRILKYMVEIMEHHLKQSKEKILPLIVPMVFYHGRSVYPHSIDILDLFAENKTLAESTLYKPFQLIDMSTIPDEEIRSRQWAGILQFFMKHVRARDFLPYLQQILPQLRRLELLGGKDYIISTLTYVYQTGNIPDEEKFFELIKEITASETGEQIMTLAELHTQRGVQAGKAEVAHNLLHRGYAIDEIVEVTGLSPQEIIQLKTLEKETIK